MRIFFIGVLAASLALVGCARKPFNGPTVKAFEGHLVQQGRPVTFPQSEDVNLTVFHESGTSFGIPIGPDGSFKIGWMPIGKYSVMVNRAPKRVRTAPTHYNVPGGLEIVDGRTEYKIELGKRWRS